MTKYIVQIDSGNGWTDITNTLDSPTQAVVTYISFKEAAVKVRILEGTFSEVDIAAVADAADTEEIK